MSLSFRENGSEPPIILVMGLGGAGGNAVHNMFLRGIHNVAFAVCNTDRQALDPAVRSYAHSDGAKGDGGVRLRL